MIKKFLTILLIFLSVTSAFAFEDCIVVTDGKLTDISIEDNTIVDVYPQITIMNDKNTLFVHPLKAGQTRFCILKNNKNICMFNIIVNDIETIVNAPEGFEVLTLDSPDGEKEFNLDEPPEEITR